MTSSGAARFEVASGGFHSGPAAAMMTSAASVSRSKVSHHGVRDGVSSLGAISNKSRVGGKLMRRGRGGTSRSSHHKHRQAEQAEQHQRLREAERQGTEQADHAALP